MPFGASLKWEREPPTIRRGARVEWRRSPVHRQSIVVWFSLGMATSTRVRTRLRPWVDPSLVALGQRVRVTRARLGLSQRGLERLAGVDQSVISRFERGQRPKLSATAVARILVALGIVEVEYPPGSGRLVRTIPRRLDLIARDEYQKEMRAYVASAEDPEDAFVETWNIQVELGERVIGRPWA